MIHSLWLSGCFQPRSAGRLSDFAMRAASHDGQSSHAPARRVRSGKDGPKTHTARRPRKKSRSDASSRKCPHTENGSHPSCSDKLPSAGPPQLLILAQVPDSGWALPDGKVPRNIYAIRTHMCMNRRTFPGQRKNRRAVSPVSCLSRAFARAECRAKAAHSDWGSPTRTNHTNRPILRTLRPEPVRTNRADGHYERFHTPRNVACSLQPWPACVTVIPSPLR